VESRHKYIDYNLHNGISIEASTYTAVLNNLVGNLPTGSSADYNELHGVRITGGHNNSVTKNTISGNLLNGIRLSDTCFNWINRVGCKLSQLPGPSTGVSADCRH